MRMEQRSRMGRLGGPRPTRLQRKQGKRLDPVLQIVIRLLARSRANSAGRPSTRCPTRNSRQRFYRLRTAARVERETLHSSKLLTLVSRRMMRLQMCRATTSPIPPTRNVNHAPRRISTTAPSRCLAPPTPRSSSGR